ncbi:MAG: SH3 domain-containing protein [Candidatus Aminicenantes bacterium]|nr:SH3 domain-containing protein [Candidatus Aminicenantes bacterium]
MKKKIFFLGLLAVAALLLAGKVLVVQVLHAQLLAKPDFLSSNLASIQKGASLEVIETKGNWYLVKSANGVKGYVHQSALANRESGLSGIAPGKKGASEEELALAAKGFNEGNEKQLRGSREYDFAAVDWVMAQDVANPDVGAFVREGKLK